MVGEGQGVLNFDDESRNNTASLIGDRPPWRDIQKRKRDKMSTHDLEEQLVCLVGHTNMSIPVKHHYLPVFYLNRWTGADGRLCQFSRPHNDVVSHRKHPTQTGYVKRLYELPGLQPEEAQRIEQGFMQGVDSLAAEALAMLEEDNPRITRESKPRSAWSRFIMSLLMRTPEDVAALKSGIAEEWMRNIPQLEANYAVKRGPADPATLEEFLAQREPENIERWAMSLAPHLIDHRKIGELLNNMRWLVRRIASDTGEFLTSDRPVVMSWTLTEQNAYLFLPIGPKAMFVAVNDVETQRMVEERDPAEQVEAINRFVVGRAIKYVYARDDKVLHYVRKHMGTLPRKTLIEKLAERRIHNQR